MRLESYPTFIPGTSTAAGFTSAPNQVMHMGFGSVAIVATGTPTGTLKLQGSNDNVSFADLGLSQAISASGNYIILIPNMAFGYIQAVWTGSGTGTLTGCLYAKGF